MILFDKKGKAIAYSFDEKDIHLISGEKVASISDDIIFSNSGEKIGIISNEWVVDNNGDIVFYIDLSYDKTIIDKEQMQKNHINIKKDIIMKIEAQKKCYSKNNIFKWSKLSNLLFFKIDILKETHPF